jgi:hypothetical protein
VVAKYSRRSTRSGSLRGQLRDARALAERGCGRAAGEIPARHPAPRGRLGPPPNAEGKSPHRRQLRHRRHPRHRRMAARLVEAPSPPLETPRARRSAGEPAPQTTTPGGPPAVRLRRAGPPCCAPSSPQPARQAAAVSTGAPGALGPDSGVRAARTRRWGRGVRPRPGRRRLEVIAVDNCLRTAPGSRRRRSIPALSQAAQRATSPVRQSQPLRAGRRRIPALPRLGRPPGWDS